MPPTSLTAVAPRSPRAVIWLLVSGSAAAVLLTGMTATVLILAQRDAGPGQIGVRFWLGLLAACAVTMASLALRALRWVFLLRRCETRIPIRDAYIGYFSGLSLLLAPLLLGEIAVRAHVLKARGGVPPLTTTLVTIWERLLDGVAVAAIVGVVAIARERLDWAIAGLLPAAILLGSGAARRGVVESLGAALRRLWGERTGVPALGWRLARRRTWATAFGVSLIVWMLPGCALWASAAIIEATLSPAQAIELFARSTLAGATHLAPGGVVVAGGQLTDGLMQLGMTPSGAATLTFGVRLATAGLAMAVGAVFLLVHYRSSSMRDDDHFDAIAGSYDVQIPEARRLALLHTKTGLMAEVLKTRGVGRRGLDIGCGQGWYVGRMRALGFDVTGIDSAAGQVALAARNLGDARLTRVGSALSIPAPDGSFDFAYAINVLHHLSSVDEQRRAHVEIMRILRPGGLFFLHEINTRNVFFRFYMGYVFPSLNCIDEGVERWLLPNELGHYTSAPIESVHYFTFLPEFTPAFVMRALGPVERWLERSALRELSAHYMAVLRKPASE